MADLERVGPRPTSPPADDAAKASADNVLSKISCDSATFDVHSDTPLVAACWEPNWDTSVYKRKKNCKKRRDPMEPQK